jgi:hypothetical protein
MFDLTLDRRDTMQASPDTTSTFEELDRRENDGIAVSLLWNRAENRLTVVVDDDRTAESFEIPTAPKDALDVFHHPYAYAFARAA